jgi:hypothetical protein
MLYFNHNQKEGVDKMQSLLEWLAVALIKILHFPFLASGYTKIKNQKESNFLDLGDLGDNVPYVFITNSNTLLGVRQRNGKSEV